MDARDVLQFDRVMLPEETQTLRGEVRAFLADNDEHLERPNSDFTTGHDPEFSRKLGARGWIGMTWPERYGGAERSFFDRYVVTEELLAAGAPVSAHWIADRQSGNLILSVGTDAQKDTYLPPIARGEQVQGGWLINGTKLWSTDAHRNHFMIALVRTEPPSDNRHAGLSQIIIDLREDGAAVRPIRNMAGGEDFNEVVFEDVLVPEDRVVGEPGNGWKQVTGELAYERSGPERFLSAFRVFVELVRAAGPEPEPALAAAIGRLGAHLATLRRMSISVAGMLEAGKSPEVEAALVKGLGNDFEKLLPEVARLAAADADAGSAAYRGFREALADTLLLSPSFTIRGGTREILRGVIARGLGLR